MHMKYVSKVFIFFAFIVFFLILVIVPNNTAFANDAVIDSGSCGEGVAWTVTGESSNILTISGSGVMNNYDSSTVPWKDYKSKINSIIVGDGVTDIGDYAFSDCTILTTLILPEGITNIGNCAFSNCIRLNNIILPDNLERIGDNAFSTCSSLTSMIIPQGVSYIGKEAFSDCVRLSDITFQNCDASIGSKAFYGCAGLRELTIPGTIINIGDSAFEDCTNLHFLNIQNGIQKIGNRTFCGCRNLTNVTIPKSVTSIGNYVFSRCNSLVNIIIPDGVTSIGVDAFLFCSSLTNVTIPDSVISIGAEVFLGCSSLTNVTIPDSVTSIGTSAFSGCSSLTNVTIPDSVTSIGARAFYECRSLDKIKIPSSVTSIGADAFHIQCVIIVKNLSYAETYAIINNFQYITICETHVWNDYYTVDKEASHSEEGLESIHCSICDEIKEGSSKLIEKIPAPASYSLAGLYINDSNIAPSFIVDYSDQHTNTKGIGFDPVFDAGTQKYVSRTYGGSKTFVNVWVKTVDPDATVRCLPVDGVGNVPAYTNDDGSLPNKGTNGNIRFPVYWIKDRISAEVKIVVTSPSGNEEEYSVELVRSEDVKDIGSKPLYLQASYKSDDNKSIKLQAMYGDKDVTGNCTWYSNESKVATVDRDGNVTVQNSDGNVIIAAYYGTLKTFVELTVEEGKFSSYCKTHDFGAWFITKPATCVETGINERVCHICGEKETEETPLIGHSWDTKYTIDKKATYATTGSQSIHCSVCDDKKPDSTVSIPKLKVTVPTPSKPTASKKGFTARWKKVSGVTGYEVQYALNSKFTKSKKTVKITKATITSKKVTKLKAKKTYYVRIRAYKKVGGKTYYSTWSKAKTVKTK